MSVFVTRLARLDIEEAAAFLAQDDLNVGLRFFDAVESSIELLKSAPRIGRQMTINEEDVRMWFVKGFRKYLIFYTENSSEVKIVRVIHSVRDYTRVLTRKQTREPR